MFFFSSKYNSDDASNPLGNISVYLVERNISLLERIISGKDYQSSGKEYHSIGKNYQSSGKDYQSSRKDYQSSRKKYQSSGKEYKPSRKKYQFSGKERSPYRKLLLKSNAVNDVFVIVFGIVLEFVIIWLTINDWFPFETATANIPGWCQHFKRIAKKHSQHILVNFTFLNC